MPAPAPMPDRRRSRSGSVVRAPRRHAEQPAHPESAPVSDGVRSSAPVKRVQFAEPEPRPPTPDKPKSKPKPKPKPYACGAGISDPPIEHPMDENVLLRMLDSAFEKMGLVEAFPDELYEDDYEDYYDRDWDAEDDDEDTEEEDEDTEEEDDTDDYSLRSWESESVEPEPEPVPEPKPKSSSSPGKLLKQLRGELKLISREMKRMKSSSSAGSTSSTSTSSSKRSLRQVWKDRWRKRWSKKRVTGSSAPESWNPLRARLGVPKQVQVTTDPTADGAGTSWNPLRARRSKQAKPQTTTTTTPKRKSRKGSPTELAPHLPDLEAYFEDLLVLFRFMESKHKPTQRIAVDAKDGKGDDGSCVPNEIGVEYSLEEVLKDRRVLHTVPEEDASEEDEEEEEDALSTQDTPNPRCTNPPRSHPPRRLEEEEEESDPFFPQDFGNFPSPRRISVPGSRSPRRLEEESDPFFPQDFGNASMPRCVSAPCSRPPRCIEAPSRSPPPRSTSAPSRSPNRRLEGEEQKKMFPALDSGNALGGSLRPPRDTPPRRISAPCSPRCVDAPIRSPPPRRTSAPSPREEKLFFADFDETNFDESAFDTLDFGEPFFQPEPEPIDVDESPIFRITVATDNQSRVGTQSGDAGERYAGELHYDEVSDSFSDTDAESAFAVDDNEFFQDGGGELQPDGEDSRDSFQSDGDGDDVSAAVAAIRQTNRHNSDTRDFFQLRFSPSDDSGCSSRDLADVPAWVQKNQSLTSVTVLRDARSRDLILAPMTEISTSTRPGWR